MRIKIFSAVPHGACSYYRNLPYFMLRHIDKDIQVDFATTIEWDFLCNTDIVIFERPESDEIVRAMEKIKVLHIPIIADWDDDVFNIPDDNPSYEHYMSKNIQNSIIQCITLADVVTTTTENLAQKLVQFNASTCIVPNAFNNYSYSLNKKSSTNKFINWRGSITHRRDILSVSNAMIQIAKEFPDWTFSFIGTGTEFITDLLPNIRQIKEMPISTYWEFISNISCAIQIVPLQFNEFNLAKSNISFQEGTYIGASCLAPNMQEWCLPGILNYINETSFYYHLRQLIIDEELRKENFELSQKYIKENLLLSIVNRKRLEIVNQLMEKI